MRKPLIDPKFVPISPIIPDEAVFVTAPELVNRPKLEIVPKTSTAEDGLQSFKHFINTATEPVGIIASVPIQKVIAPAEGRRLLIHI